MQWENLNFVYCIKRGRLLSKEHLNSIKPSTQSAKKVHVYMLIMQVLIEENFGSAD